MTVRPDPDQEAVLAGVERNVVVVAPPGTGKTALAARLAARDADRTQPHERVLVLTFSNQARGQLEREVAKVLTSAQRRKVEVTNYHKFLWSAVRAYRSALGLPSELSMSSWRRRLAILRGADRAAVDSLSRQRHLLETMAEQAHAEIALPTGLARPQIGPLLTVIQDEHARGNLVYEDLGALFWTLITRYPTVRAAYAARYPFVIADEHQDASSLQDALVRELGSRGRVILADPMQLIHGWRGADEQRLQAHRDECEHEYTLTTPHRWHGEPSVGAWLLGLRRRLAGDPDLGRAPRSASVVLTDAQHGENGMLAAVRYAVLECLRSDCASVAVLARTGLDVVRVRDHLSAHGLRPRQLGASTVLENGLTLIEDLPGLNTRRLVERALSTVYEFLPTVPTPVRRQVQGRLGTTGSRKVGSGVEAAMLLNAMDAVYFDGTSAYFAAVVRACEGLRANGHHLPRPDEYELYEAVARSGAVDSEAQLRIFSNALATWSRSSRRDERGILTMTVHQAKGREFDAVVLYGATRRAFGITDEDKRTFYVAITRGIRRWVIVAPQGLESELVSSLNIL